MNQSRQLGSGIALALLVLACVCPAFAATRITSIEPKTVQQGDTVLLTIKGDSLPTGNIRVEFFPQQIAVLSAQLTPGNNAELTAQIKVPPLATPGAYNVMVSNQLGDEAFGQALLTVVGTVRTPVFKSYDPKVIARADNGFALILTGESITPEVAPQLTASWQQNGSTVGGLTSSFTYSPGQIVCAVTGKLPTGILRGKIAMAGKPIYQLEVEVRGGTAVIGHMPSSLHSADGPLVVKLVGDDLSSGWLSKTKVTLRAGRKEIAASHVALRDGATGEVAFMGPLPAGDWTLVVAIDNVAVYQGALTVLPALLVPKQPEPIQPPMAEEPELPRTQEPLPSTEVIREVSDFNSLLSETVEQATQFIDSLEPPADWEMTEVQVGPLFAPATAVSRIRNASFVPGQSGAPSKLVLSGTNLTPDMIDRLQVELSYKGGTLAPELSMSTPAGFTYMFAAKGELGDATVTVRDPKSQVPTFRQRLGAESKVADGLVPEPVAPISTPVDSAPIQTPPTAGDTAEVSLDGPVQVDATGFALTLSGVPEGSDWNTAKLSSTHPILALNASKFSLEAPLAGSKTMLLLRRDPEALPDAVYGVLTDMLCDSASVPLRFEFTDGRSVEVSGKFVRKADPEADDNVSPTSGVLH